MIVELTNHFSEMSAQYEVERIDENRWGGEWYFRFYFGNGKWSKEYKKPKYTYCVMEV